MSRPTSAPPDPFGPRPRIDLCSRLCSDTFYSEPRRAPHLAALSDIPAPLGVSKALQGRSPSRIGPPATSPALSLFTLPHLGQTGRWRSLSPAPPSLRAPCPSPAAVPHAFASPVPQRFCFWVLPERSGSRVLKRCLSTHGHTHPVASTYPKSPEEARAELGSRGRCQGGAGRRLHPDSGKVGGPEAGVVGVAQQRECARL